MREKKRGLVLKTTALHPKDYIIIPNIPILGAVSHSMILIHRKAGL